MQALAATITTPLLWISRNPSIAEIAKTEKFQFMRYRLLVALVQLLFTVYPHLSPYFLLSILVPSDELRIFHNINLPVIRRESHKHAANAAVIPTVHDSYIQFLQQCKTVATWCWSDY